MNLTSSINVPPVVLQKLASSSAAPVSGLLFLHLLMVQSPYRIAPEILHYQNRRQLQLSLKHQATRSELFQALSANVSLLSHWHLYHIGFTEELFLQPTPTISTSDPRGKITGEKRRFKNDYQGGLPDLQHAFLSYLHQGLTFHTQVYKLLQLYFAELETRQKILSYLKVLWEEGHLSIIFAAREKAFDIELCLPDEC